MGMVLFYQKALILYWWAFISALVIAGIIITPYFRVKLLKKRIKKQKKSRKR